MTYSDAFRLEMVALADGLEADLEDLRMVENEVALVTVTRTAPDRDAGRPGTATETPTVIAPRPDWDPRDQWRSVGGERVRVGDGLLTFTRTVTEAAILGADHFLIGSRKYKLAPGHLKRGELRWEAVVVAHR